MSNACAFCFPSYPIFPRPVRLPDPPYPLYPLRCRQHLHLGSVELQQYHCTLPPPDLLPRQFPLPKSHLPLPPRSVRHVSPSAYPIAPLLIPASLYALVADADTVLVPRSPEPEESPLKKKSTMRRGK